MKSSTPLPNNDRHLRSSDEKWRQFFRSKLMENRKKPQSSTSLFWDWSKDVKDSAPPPKKSN